MVMKNIKENNNIANQDMNFLRNKPTPFPAPKNELNLLTNEGERRSENEEHAVAVHGECDSKVCGKTAPHKELVHCCPVIGVQA